MSNRYWTPGRLGLGVLVIAMIAFWGWIYIFASRENVDRFGERAFPEAAEPMCAAIQAEILALPSGQTAETPLERSEQVRAATDLTIEMVDGLRALLPLVSDQEDIDRLGLWFEDWDVYIQDREAHVVRLQEATEDTPARDLAFLVSERVSGGFYTARMDGLANVNDMESCHVPQDI